MKKLLLFISISFCMNTYAQEKTIDWVKTTNSDISFTAIDHASVVFNIGDKTVYVDPCGPKEWYRGINAPDLILITDIHHDHYDVYALEAIAGEKSVFVVPEEIFKLMPEAWKKRSHVMTNGEINEFLGISVQSVPMYNLPGESESFHQKGRGNGYVLEKNGFRIYISGDTENIPEMRSLKEIDIAFVCMNQPYTMTVENAAEAVKAFKPAKVYPYHFRNGDKSFSDVRKFTRLVGEAGLESIVLDWYGHPSKKD